MTAQRQPSTHEIILPLFAQPAGERRRYRTLVCDPPWRIAMAPAIKPAFGGQVKERLTYPTMTQEELLQLPVGAWAMDQAHLYLWTTNSMVAKAYELAEAWGFKTSALLTWIKRRERDDRWMGLGRYYRVTTEHVLFAVRGGLDVINKDQPNFFFAPHAGHSEKPSAFYDIVERMSPGPYLDVFSRKQRMRWDTWGNEAFSFEEHGYWHQQELKSAAGLTPTAL